MSGHPMRCVVDTACLAGIGAAVMGWLPIALATIASLLAIIHYGFLFYDRFKKG